jgi:antirestriction protein ArdC
LRAKEHNRWIINAASQASKAADFILNRQRPSEVIAEAVVTI